jgi:hypothetical protein
MWKEADEIYFEVRLSLQAARTTGYIRRPQSRESKPGLRQYHLRAKIIIIIQCEAEWTTMMMAMMKMMTRTMINLLAPEFYI